MTSDSTPAFEIEKEALKTEIETGIQAGVDHLEAKTTKRKDADKYHNTRHLLKQYRKVAYAIQISEADMNVRMEMEHGTRLSTLEVNAELAGVDLSGSKLEGYARTVIRSKNMLQIIDNALIWVFDETEAFANEYICGSQNDENKFVWKWPNRVLSSVVPQYSQNVAIVLQLTEENDDDSYDWLVKIEWAIADGDGYADYRRFYIDDSFCPDLFSNTGLRDILLNKRKRFDAFLRDHSPYEPKCSRVKGNPRDWYMCPITHDWHNSHCKECQHNLINEYRKGTDYPQCSRGVQFPRPRAVSGL